MLGYIRHTLMEQRFSLPCLSGSTDYPTGYRVRPQEKVKVRLEPRSVLPKWNYTIWPHNKSGKC